LSRKSLIAPAALVLVLAAACTTAPAASPSPSPAPTSPPTGAPTASPATETPTPPPAATPSPLPPETAPPTEYPAGSVVVTFRVVAEEFRILLTDPADIEIANSLLAGEEAPTIPNGLIVRAEPGVNAPWSWHLDPESIEFADVTMEVCDGLPSHVEDGTLAGDRYCPWSAEVIAVEPAG
jgi:hypothetical protein